MDDIQRYLAPIPERMHGGILRYLNDGVLPGDFLQAVLRDSLVDALGRADEENRALIWHYANMLYNAFPARGMAWGSTEAVAEWAAIGGLNGARRGPRKLSRADLGAERAERLCSLINFLGGEAEVVS